MKLAVLLAAVALLAAGTAAAPAPAAASPADRSVSLSRSAGAALVPTARRCARLRTRSARRRCARAARLALPPRPAPAASPAAGAPAPAPTPAATPPAGGDAPPPAPPPVPHSNPRSLQVRACEFFLVLSKATVLAGGVRVEFNNATAEDPHDLRFARSDGSGDVFGFGVLQSGEVQSQTFSLAAGDYRLFCALPGHEGLGMRATLSVAAA